MEINICHLYPDLLNLYGDGGNIIAFKKRLEWRNISCNVIQVSLNDPFQSDDYDIVFIGGGQDFEQEVILKDLKGEKTKQIKDAIENNTAFLGICGGYQLLGNYYQTWDNHQFDFIGALDLHTIGAEKRMIGDFVFRCPDIGDRHVVGFENHSGKTYLGDKIRPLGIVEKGYGNNGEDNTEGARYRNVFCSYSHGSLLPKNPKLCDVILDCALYNRYKVNLVELDDDLYENEANQFILKRLL